MAQIRLLQERDLPAAQALVRDVLKEEYDQAVLLELARVWSEGSMIAEENNDIVAYLQAVLPNAFEARILLFAVTGSQRNRGLGGFMFGQFLNHCALMGLKSVYLEVRASNQGGIRFYTKFGFSANAVLQKYYRDGEDAYLMRKPL